MCDSDYPEDSPGERYLFEEKMDLEARLAASEAARRNAEEAATVAYEELSGSKAPLDEVMGLLPTAAFAAAKNLRSEIAARERAERERDEYAGRAGEAEGALDAERAAHEETRRRLDCAEELAVAARVDRDAAESRLAEAEAAMREIADDFKAFVEYRGKNANEWRSYVVARAFLAGGAKP